MLELGTGEKEQKAQGQARKTRIERAAIHEFMEV